MADVFGVALGELLDIGVTDGVDSSVAASVADEVEGLIKTTRTSPSGRGETILALPMSKYPPRTDKISTTRTTLIITPVLLLRVPSVSSITVLIIHYRANYKCNKIRKTSKIP